MSFFGLLVVFAPPSLDHGTWACEAREPTVVQAVPVKGFSHAVAVDEIFHAANF